MAQGEQLSLRQREVEGGAKALPSTRTGLAVGEGVPKSKCRTGRQGEYERIQHEAPSPQNKSQVRLEHVFQRGVLSRAIPQRRKPRASIS